MSIASSLMKIARSNDIRLERIAELGVNRGVTTHKLIKAAEPSHYAAVDYWKTFDTVGKIQATTSHDEWEDIYLDLCEFSIDCFCALQLIRSDTAYAARCFDDGYFDLVFVDADHSEEGCGKDIDAWLPKVRPGGIMAGHDYSNNRKKPGVKNAVQKRFDNYKLARHLIWYVIKENN